MRAVTRLNPSLQFLRKPLRGSICPAKGELMTITTPANIMMSAHLLDRIIADGIAEVCEAYALWSEAEKITAQIARKRCIEEGDVTDYWRQRYKTLQIEWVCNVVSVGLVNNGQPPLLGHLPTARGAVKYAAIVGEHEPALA